jgi:hypothetical protein
MLAVFVTSYLTRKRDREAEWRKLKFAQYQEFILALSGVLDGRSNPAAQARYADAVNSMGIIAPLPVLKAMAAYQSEISQSNLNKVRARHDKLLDALYKALREDIHPSAALGDEASFFLIGVPEKQT